MNQPEKENVSPLEKALLKFMLFIFSCAALGIGIVLVSHVFSFSSQPTPLLTPLSAITPTPAEITNTFQKLLTNACKIISTKGKDTYTISLDQLPIILNPSNILLSTNANDGPFCKGTASEKYVALTARDGTMFYLYDKNIEQLNSFGYSLFHPSQNPLVLTNQNDNTILMFLQRSSDSTVGTEPVIVRGAKTLHLSTDETIYVTTDIPAIAGDDPLLMQVLTPFEIPSATPGKKDVDPSKETNYDDAIKKIFFSDVPIPNSPAQLPTAIEHFLQAISPK